MAGETIHLGGDVGGLVLVAAIDGVAELAGELCELGELLICAHQIIDDVAHR